MFIITENFPVDLALFIELEGNNTCAYSSPQPPGMFHSTVLFQCEAAASLDLYKIKIKFYFSGRT